LPDPDPPEPKVEPLDPPEFPLDPFELLELLSLFPPPVPVFAFVAALPIALLTPLVEMLAILPDNCADMVATDVILVSVEIIFEVTIRFV
jgi:hypothetical protein